jgi:phosphatidylserine/phosphatidylglycerophosphate/cardiolipin synthase-like enzyme
MVADVTPLSGGYFYDELIKCIDNSRLFIYSVQYQWKWNIHQRHSHVQRLGAAIEQARRRNVDVRVILHQESQNRNLTKINRVAGNYLSCLGCQVKMFPPSSFLHAKIWLIDGRYSFVGSHNISTRSLTTNEEFSVKIDSVEFAKIVKDYFDILWGK